MPGTINTEVQNPKGRVFRRLYVKRRLAATGLFESSWQELTDDVKSWGRISKSIDHVRYSRVRFSDLSLVMANDNGRYNPETDEASFWYGYASQQRSLVRVDAGFIHQTQSSGGVWTNTWLPSDATVFVGMVQGDIFLSDDNQVQLPVKPLLQVFRDFATRNLTGLTSTGMTASQFIALLRDQTAGAGDYVFRPFFQDTTTNWDFTSSSIVYRDINTSPSSARPSSDPANPPQNDFVEMNCWDAIETLAEAENLVPYITRDGKFKFRNRDPNTTAAAWEFFGRGFLDGNYGVTVKRVNRYGRKFSDYYSRVEVKWLDDLATTTAIVATQTAMTVNGSNTAWLYGHRTFQIENLWLATVTSANTLANTVFAAISAVNNELDFTTSFVPHLELLDRVAVSYESSERALNSRWDTSDWAEDSTSTASDLIWVNPEGDAIRFTGKEFKLTSIELNLDTLESRFIGIAL